MNITLHKIYMNVRDKSEGHERFKALLEQTDWFCRSVEFDPKTGDALPQALSVFLAKIARPSADGVIRDRLWRITEHSRASVERLFRSLNESPRREHALLPIHAVRELDANSFIKLSNRPGRTIREKLAGKPYLQAVRRFQSVNLPENRVLKAFVVRLAELLELRRDCLGEEEDELLHKIQSWLRSEEADDIARWDNLPPNNTLLSHRDYRRIWDAWGALEKLDDEIATDFSQLEERSETMRSWNQYARMWLNGGHLFADMPVFFRYDKFEVSPWLSPLAIRETQRAIVRQFDVKEIRKPVCVDMTALRPYYAVTATTAQSLPEVFLWQQWNSDGKTEDIALFNADTAYIHPEATSISSPELFFLKDNNSEHFDRAARAFASHLHDVFKNDTLIWLAPDFLNDFQLEVIRRNLNSRFFDAEPLPRSVAAVFEQVDYSNIKNDGFAVVVVDSIGGKTCATKLVANFDEELKKRLPETRGFYWERCPSVEIKNREPESTEQSYDIITIDEKGQWREAVRPENPKAIELSILKRDKRIGQFDDYIHVTKSPVGGGIRLHDLQQHAGDIPLWRDQIPKLSIKGRNRPFCLVSRGTTIKPIRGKPVQITVNANFTLPAEGQTYYTFELLRGDSDDDMGFSARLDSPQFPLEKGKYVVCKLNLTFEYGADEPYKLVFMPCDKSFPPVHATWRRTEEVIITDAVAPEYPIPLTWDNLRRVAKQNSDETNDLMEWVKTSMARLDYEFYISPKPRTIGVISSSWLTGKTGHFAFAKCQAMAESVLIHENNFVHGLSYATFTEGNSISFELREREGKYSGWKVAESGYKETRRLKDLDKESSRKLIEKIRKRFSFPVFQIWRDGRSISDQECPKTFICAMQTGIGYLVTLLKEDAIPEPVKNVILFLLSCMHKDAPDECVEWITKQAENGKINARAIGFALGDVSEQWQEYVLSKLVANLTNDVLRAFACAIWRERHFVEKFNYEELKSILDKLSIMLKNIKRCPPRKNTDDIWTVRNWERATLEPLELLLGLLRTRASSNNEIKMLLQPHQKITKELAKQIEHVAEIVEQSKVQITSRVQLMNLPQKPEGDHTPDLLYALRLYLTGDGDANAIHITSVSDED